MDSAGASRSPRPPRPSHLVVPIIQTVDIGIGRPGDIRTIGILDRCRESTAAQSI